MATSAGSFFYFYYPGQPGFGEAFFMPDRVFSLKFPEKMLDIGIFTSLNQCIRAGHTTVSMCQA